MSASLIKVPSSIQHSQYELFKSTDIDEARAKVGEVYCDHKLEAKQGYLDAFHYHIPFDGISFNYMGYGSECAIEPGCLGDFYLLQLPIKGHAAIYADGELIESYPGKASILNPKSYTKMVWSEGCEQLMVQIAKDKVHSSLSGCLGTHISSDIAFDQTLLSNDKQAAWWRHVISFVSEYNQATSFYSAESILQNELDNIVKGLLYALDHNHSDTLLSNEKVVLPKHVKQATDYIQDHCREKLTIQDLVNLTGVSERSLFEGFKNNLNLTPMQFLMQIRLSNVRSELLKGSHDNLSNITQVAMDNGFNQLGRFSYYYRKVFGELPSETLKHKSASKLSRK